MPGQSAFRLVGRHGAGGATGGGAMHFGLVLVLVLVSVVAATLLPVPSVRAAVMATDAASYVPTLANLPPGYREESADAVGGDLEPTISLRRSFVSQDGSQRVVVDVSLGSSIENAHDNLNGRLNQLIRYQDWRIVPNAPFGEIGFRGSGPTPEGANSSMIAFRIQAVFAEVNATSIAGEIDLPLLDNLARLVERRINADPEAVAYQPGWPTEPVRFPGKDPVYSPIGIGSGAIRPPGAEVTGSSSASPIQGDTVIVLTIEALERPWTFAGILPPPQSNMEYMTVQVQISAIGPTEVDIAQADFWINTFDGRSWTPIPVRRPALLTGAVRSGSPATGWLTFMVPRDQPAQQLNWRIRTRQSLTGQGGVEQTMVIPVAVGASGQAGVGTSAPPPSVPVVPSFTAPSGRSGLTFPPGARGRGSGLE